MRRAALLSKCSLMLLLGIGCASSTQDTGVGAAPSGAGTVVTGAAGTGAVKPPAVGTAAGAAASPGVSVTMTMTPSSMGAGAIAPTPGTAGVPAMPVNPGPAIPATVGEPRIPKASGECPMLKTGMVQVMGQQVQLWVGTKQTEKKGSVMFYWHGTGSQSGMAMSDLGPAVAEIVADGGMVASFSTTTMKGDNTGNNVWYTGDFEMADHLLACAIDQLNIDTHRVYAGGCSAGGLQASAMLYQRSSYLAGVMPNSGGNIMQYQNLYKLEDPGHVPALITTHGAHDADMVVIYFAETSAAQDKDVASKGGFVVNCDHGGAHCGSPAPVKAAQWRFLKDHPFGVSPEPYAAGLPADFPMSCKVVSK